MEPSPSLEEQKKLVLPFLQRAEEIQAADPKVAYYCRLYAVDQALRLERRAKEINGLLGAAMATLERDKPRLALDKDQDKVHCEAFALRIFANADRVDRAGRADVNTSKAFYAASYFLEILNQWGPLDADLGGKQRYAAWRAAEIYKAAREGRPPVPPPSDSTRSANAGDEAGPSGSGAEGGGSDGGYGISSLNIAGANVVHDPGAPPSAASSAPPAYEHSSSWGSAPPAATPGSDWSVPTPTGSSLLPGQRYRPGSPVFYCESAGGHQEQGTVGQVTHNPGQGFSYRVALRDRLVEAHDDQVCPAPAEGSRVGYLSRAGAETLPAEVVLVNDGMGWPVTYMVRLSDGMEVAAEAHQLTFVLPQEEQHARSGTPDSYASAPSLNLPPPPMFAPPPSAATSFATPHPGGSAGGYPSIQGQAAGGMGGLAPPPGHAPPPPSAPSAPPPPQPTYHAPPPAAPSAPPPITHQPSYPPPSQHPPSQPQPPKPAAPPAYTAPPPPPAAAAPAGASHGYGSHAAAAAAPAATSFSVPALPPGFKPSVQAIADAQKNCKYAISSLNFEDVHSAVKYLTAALQLLSTQGR